MQESRKRAIKASRKTIYEDYYDKTTNPIEMHEGDKVLIKNKINIVHQLETGQDCLS